MAKTFEEYVKTTDGSAFDNATMYDYGECCRHAAQAAQRERDAFRLRYEAEQNRLLATHEPMMGSVLYESLAEELDAQADAILADTGDGPSCPGRPLPSSR